jgi:hypothetical protein
MVTNRKSDSTTISNDRNMPRDSFTRLLQRRAAGEDLEQLKAERLAAWDELGRAFAAGGWHELETAIAAACEVVHDRKKFGPAIGAVEAEQLAERFAVDCARMLDAGGAEALWHVVAADHETPHPDMDDLADRWLQPAAARDATAIAKFVDAARCYALAVFARGQGIEQLRRLFGPDAEQLAPEVVEDFAPFAIDNDGDEHARRVRDAAMLFAIADSDALRLEAVQQYAYGFEMTAASSSLHSFQRLGLIAWVARRCVKGDDQVELTEVDDAEAHQQWMEVGARLRARAPVRFRALVAEAERFTAIEDPTPADLAEHERRFESIALADEPTCRAAAQRNIRRNGWKQFGTPAELEDAADGLQAAADDTRREARARLAENIATGAA